MKPQNKILTPTLLAFSALGAYFAVLFVGGLINADKASVIAPKFIIYFNPLTYALIWLAAAVILVAYGSISKPMVYRFTWLAAFAYAMRTAVAGGSYYLTFAMCGLMAVMTYACGRALHGEKANAKPVKSAAQGGLTPAAAKVVVGVMAALIGGGILFLLLSAYLTSTTAPSGHHRQSLQHHIWSHILYRNTPIGQKYNLPLPHSDCSQLEFCISRRSRDIFHKKAECETRHILQTTYLRQPNYHIARHRFP